MPPNMLPFHEDYHPLAEIAQFSAALERKYPERVKRVALGHSARGREMEALLISANVNEMEDDNIKKKKDKKKKKKRSFVITGAQHAREVSNNLLPLTRIKSFMTHSCLY